MKYLTVEELRDLAQTLINQGKGDYTVAVNDEYDLVQPPMISVDDTSRKVDLGGIFRL